MSQTIYRQRYAKFVIGTLYGLGVPRVRSFSNNADSTYETWTIAVPASPDDSTAYSVTVDGVTATSTTDASATQAELYTDLIEKIRLTDIYDKVKLTGNSSTYVITLECRKQSTPMAVTVAGGALSAVLTASRTIQAASPTDIPYGRIVGRQATDAPGTVRLMASTSDIPQGIALATYANEKTGSNQDAYAAYTPKDAVDVLDRTNTCEGVWVECVEASGIDETDTVYVSVASGHEGKVTASSSGTVALPTGRFMSGVELDVNGRYGILVSVNMN